MKPIFKILAVTCGATLLGHSSPAAEIIVMPASGSILWSIAPENPLSQILRRPQVQSSQAIFSEGERQALRSYGQSSLALAQRLTVEDSEAILELRQWVKQSRLPLLIEENLEARLSDFLPADFLPADATPESRDPLERLQWGLHNHGEPQLTTLDDLSRIAIPGHAGEDIGLDRIPPAFLGRHPGRPITIAILDTGVDVTHPDLIDRIARHGPECEAVDKLNAGIKDLDTQKSVESDSFKKRSTALQDTYDAKKAAALAEIAKLSKSKRDAEKKKRLGEIETERKTAAAALDKEKTAALAVWDAKKVARAKQWESVDADGNGYPLDCNGWNVSVAKLSGLGVFGDNDTKDERGHGTHIAGVIAASLNGQGVRGIAPDALILPVKVIRTASNDPIRPQSLPEAGDPPQPKESDLQKSGFTGAFVDVLARGVLYAVRSNVDIIHMSLAWPRNADSPIMHRMIDLARSRGIAIVASAGNDSTQARVMPCQYDGVICVGSHGPDGSLSHFSNFGSTVEIAAPGLRVLSTWPMALRPQVYTEFPGYELKSGTSMAAPFVTGSLARLLQAGFSRDEATARILVSARPGRAPEIALSTRDKYTLTGNLDLGAAFSVNPQPLILPATKQVITLNWDLAARELQIKIPLKNTWAAATRVELSAVIRNEDQALAHLAPSSSSMTVENWESMGTRTFQTTLLIDSPKVDGRLWVDVTARALDSAGSAVSRSFRIPVEIQVPITTQLSAPSVQSLLILKNGAPSPLSARASIRTVTNLVPGTVQDYVSVEKGSGKIQFQLLKDMGSTYAIISESTFADTGDLLMQVQKLNSSEPLYAFQFQKSLNGVSLGAVRFEIYNERFELIQKIEHDNKIASFSSRFFWIAPTEKTPYWSVAWISHGTTPPLEKAPDDPWEPNPEDASRTRVYYVTPQGLHSFLPLEGSSLVDLLSTDGNGAEILLYSADRSSLTYSRAHVDSLGISNTRAISLAQYHLVQATADIDRVTSVSRSQVYEGTSLSVPGSGGSYRTTLIQSTQANDIVSRPPSVIDSVKLVAGIYLGDQTRSIFAQTNYELQYENLLTGESATTSMNRYTFIPSLVTQNALFPAVIDEGALDLTPGILIPFGQGEALTVEVVVPEKDAAGRLDHLAKPAAFRLSPSMECDPIGNPLESLRGTPTRVAFACGDRILRVSLTLPQK